MSSSLKWTLQNVLENIIITAFKFITYYNQLNIEIYSSVEIVLNSDVTSFYLVHFPYKVQMITSN